MTEERIAQVETKVFFFFSNIFMDAGLKHIVCAVFHFQQDCFFFRNGNKNDYRTVQKINQGGLIINYQGKFYLFRFLFLSY